MGRLNTTRSVNRRSGLLVLLLAASVVNAGHAADETDPNRGAFTARQLIEIALRDNKDLQVARYAIAVGQARLLQAGLPPNPRIDLSRATDVLFKNDGEYTNSVGISQQFPVAGRLMRQKDVARADIAIAEAEIAEAQRRIAGEIAADVYRMLVIDQQIQSRKDLAAIEENLAKTTRDRFKVAEVSELEVNTVQLDLKRLAQEQALLQGQRQSFEIALNKLLGRADTIPVAIAEPLPKIDTPLPDLKLLQAQALETRPEVSGARLAIEKAQAQRALARAERWEDWTVGLGVQQDKSVIDGATPQSRDRAIVLSLSIPLPLLNKNQGLIAEAQASEDQAGARIEALRLGITAEVVTAYADVSNLRSSLEGSQKDLLPVSARNVRLAQKGYREGLVSVVEVVQAQRQQGELNATYLTTLDQYLQALVRLRTATGDYLVSTTGARADAKEQ